MGLVAAVPEWELLLQLKSTSTNLPQPKLGFVGFLCLGGGLCLWPLYNYDGYKIATSSVSASWQLWGNDLIWTANSADLEPYQKLLFNEPRTSRQLPGFAGNYKNRLVRFFHCSTVFHMRVSYKMNPQGSYSWHIECSSSLAAYFMFNRYSGCGWEVTFYARFLMLLFGPSLATHCTTAFLQLCSTSRTTPSETWTGQVLLDKRSFHFKMLLCDHVWGKNRVEESWGSCTAGQVFWLCTGGAWCKLHLCSWKASGVLCKPSLTSH